MPDYSTLIPLATPLVALIGSIAALVGVWLTQRNNRKTKLIELDHQRQLKDKELNHQGGFKDQELRAQERLKALELQEETRKILRSEKRDTYKDVLRDSRLGLTREPSERWDS